MIAAEVTLKTITTTVQRAHVCSSASTKEVIGSISAQGYPLRNRQRRRNDHLLLLYEFRIIIAPD